MEAAVLPTFVIGLREGLEASLIVGIVAAFLRQSDRRDALRQVWLGVGLAMLLCLGIGIALQVLDRELPQRQQEALETVIGLIAVTMVTYMVVWMRRNSRDLKRSLETATASALETGSTRALVAMAFLAVLREGFETAVFLIAAFNASTSPATAGTGALLGVLVAVAIGVGIYRGGVRINLSRFFRLTGLVLVLVAAGLLATAAHTGHEAGWLNTGQKQIFDMSWLVRPGTPLASVLTGVLGLQPRPVVAEFLAWIVYLVPLALYVGWPARRRPPAPTQPTPTQPASPQAALPESGLSRSGLGTRAEAARRAQDTPAARSAATQ
jgi:high-affinity iron transporter